LNTENGASTPVESLQQQREAREERRAQERARDQQQKLRARGRESRTTYGNALLQRYAETVGCSIDALLIDLFHNPGKAGPHFAHWPLLLHFSSGGPRSIAAITLSVVIDGISTSPLRASLANAIGRALQDELKATRLHDEKGGVLLAQLRKKFGRKTVSDKLLGQLNVDPSGWDLNDRRGLGNLLLEVIAANTDLIAFRKVGKESVVATEATLELIKLNPPLPLLARDLPSLLPPVPWEGPTRGTKNLVGSRAPMDRGHLTTRSLTTAIQVVNRIEQQQLVVDPWMVEVQREAWDCNLPVVFPVRREPETPWVMPAEAGLRLRTEEAIRQGEEVAGRPIWLKHDMDFRGRLYCCSRMAGHQGPDHQKALISFAQRERMDDEAVDALLAAAAGHYGLGHCSWSERAQWGRAHLDQMAVTAANPLDRFDLWKSADDPWQYLQACKAIADFLEDEATPIGCPVRYDQTASGMGIIGALTRDELLCRRTNMIGGTRSDLYAVIAEAVLNQLRMHLDSWDPYEVRMAEFWLKLPISRSLAKGPTMTMVYGARHFGIVEQLVAWLQEHNPDVPVAYWEKEYTRPAQYMARVFNEVLGQEMRSCVALQKWLRDVSKACVKKQQRIQWVSPMGFPLAFGAQLEEKQRTTTKIHGARRWARVDADVEPGELSARATNRGITANTIHAFDGALVQAMVLRSGMVDAPLLTNHDCFATIPSRARWLHHELLLNLRQLYLPDWLADLRVEIGRNAGVHLPHPPIVGDLREAMIGENPYCFC
jgi:hypothetical protein